MKTAARCLGCWKIQSLDSMSSLREQVSAPPSSTWAAVTTPSFTTRAKRLQRFEPSLARASSTTPSSAASAPCMSARYLISPPSSLPHAAITKGSFTDTQRTCWTPFALSLDKSCTKPGKCVLLHVGVNAPGTPTITTTLPLQRSARQHVSSGVAPKSVIGGIASPTRTWRLRRDARYAQGRRCVTTHPNAMPITRDPESTPEGMLESMK
mmetsp:Transcript_4056/g.11719  ORF Transcript_4056/g.11719 Transcript_4056/m.11719 type:complete len:210 (-) Transcript_4056:40-669(-)